MSRPDPPPHLTKEQAQSWREIVERMPPNWFLPETLPVLEARCVQIARQREMAVELNTLKGKRFSNHHFKLLREENAGVKTLVSLATRLRPTPQSTVSKNKQKPVVPIRSGGLMAFSERFEQGEIGPDLFRKACEFGLEGVVSKHRDRPYRGGKQKFWVKVKNRSHPAMERVLESYR